jgi:alpha-ketoglutarate-dependent taurine dioxygenase/molybdopterin converting factor small subunit
MAISSNFKELHEFGTANLDAARTEDDPEIRAVLIESARYYFKSSADGVVESVKTKELKQIILSGDGVMSGTGDTYNVENTGQITSVGAGNTVEGNTFTQNIIKQAEEEIEQNALVSELESLLPKLKQRATATGNDGDFTTVGEAVRALESAKAGDKESALKTITELKPRLEQLISDSDTAQISKFYRETNRDLISDLERARIHPWQGSLHHEDFLIECQGINDIEQRSILKNIERYGICQIRLQNQPPEDYVVESLYKLMGQPADRQNDFEGIVKNLLPTPGIEANTGSSAGDLGFHVDGTQADLQPALLVFQYVATANLGGNSRFADTAKVLLDIEPEQSEQLLINLARKDAAAFSKKGMEHVGPVFSFPDGYSLACRVRYDSVLTINPDCENNFQLLKSRFDDPKYQALFKPRPGDVIVFDNWRIMHARDEIYSQVQRHHRRVWLNFLRQELQSRYFLGIRPVSDGVKARIKEANGIN